MSKIYELYGSNQRVIDNLKRKIRGYKKMRKDITSQNRKVNNQNRKLQQENKKYKEVINKANKWIRAYMDEWNMNDEVWQNLNDLLILLEEVEHEKN